MYFMVQSCIDTVRWPELHQNMPYLSPYPVLNSAKFHEDIEILRKLANSASWLKIPHSAENCGRYLLVWSALKLLLYCTKYSMFINKIFVSQSSLDLIGIWVWYGVMGCTLLESGEDVAVQMFNVITWLMTGTGCLVTGYLISNTRAPETGAINRLHFLAPVIGTGILYHIRLEWKFLVPNINVAESDEDDEFADGAIIITPDIVTKCKLKRNKS